jgi:DNA-binding MarR family transcriptional regulator
VTGPSGLDHTGNLLGALSLLISDRTRDAVGSAAGRSDSAAAALSALLHFLDRPSVDQLRQVLGLTSSGTVRLVDRLAAAGYVQREAGPDRRSTALRLTSSGRRAAQRVAEARAHVLDEALGALSVDERATLDRLLGRLLVPQVRSRGATRWICRMCDTVACGREEGRCPVANAALSRDVSER